MNTVFIGTDNHVLTKGKDKMCGLINMSANKADISIPKLKELGKKLKLTINDIVLTATSQAIKEYMKIAGDPLGTNDDAKINILMPANIRYNGMYKTREEVQLENKFATLPMKIPLVPGMQNSYSKITKVLAPLKGSFPFVYASYAMTYWMSNLSPRVIPNVLMDTTSRNFTLAFSNTPGPIKKLVCKSSAG